MSKSRVAEDATTPDEISGADEEAQSKQSESEAPQTEQSESAPEATEPASEQSPPADAREPDDTAADAAAGPSDSAVTEPEAEKQPADAFPQGEGEKPPLEDTASSADSPDTTEGDKATSATPEPDADDRPEAAATPEPDAPRDAVTPEAEAHPASAQAEPETHKTEAPPPAPPQPVGKTAVFPLLIGGVLAGAIGYGAHYLTVLPPPQGDEIADIRNEISGLRAELSAMPAAPDMSALESELADLRTQIAALPSVSEAEISALIEAEIAQMRDQLEVGGEQADLSTVFTRLDEFETTLTESSAAQASELDAMRATLAQAEEQVSALGAEVGDLRDLAERRVVEAEAAVDDALARSGLDSLRAALETGAPYSDAVDRLGAAGVDVPDALIGPAPTGIPTLETLQEDFPQAARAALRDALQDSPADSTAERLGNFLRAQVGARSITPREGDDPDAVLSRAGAAVDSGDLSAALEELSALPDPAQAAMGGWMNAAEARIAADDALAGLTNSITTE